MHGMPSMVALTTTLPSFSEPPDTFYPPQEMPGPRLSADPGARRQESPQSEELLARDKGSELLNFSESFQSIAGETKLYSSDDEKLDLKSAETPCSDREEDSSGDSENESFSDGNTCGSLSQKSKLKGGSQEPLAPGASAGKSRRRRTAFTSEQLLELEKEFHCKKYLSLTERSQIAHALKLSE
ncbi:hypothetical protein Z043_107940, partial [Scleropages formosus]